MTIKYIIFAMIIIAAWIFIAYKYKECDESGGVLVQSVIGTFVCVHGN